MEKYKDKLKDFYSDFKRLPSYSEMLVLFNLKSKNSIYKLINKLVEFDFIKKDQKGRIVPGNSFYDLRVLGSIQAGFPSAAEEELVDTMSLDEFLIKNKQASYILKVSGYSMRDAGILDGDMVIVERGSLAHDGDIVIAEIDGEWTMKYFRQRGSKVYLEAANKEYQDIVPQEELKIAAVVKAVIRKYL
ncbi:repressor LexA [Patescibacteria group bacterium]|nr:repressor LexA [Patescibacteria group bacterium]